jgi:cytochrome c oxidase subunit 3
MISEMKIVEEAKQPLGMNPKKFILWLFMASIAMLFGAFTSAYIVKRGDRGWSEIILPDQFLTSTIVIALSSLTMIWAYRMVKKDNLEGAKLALGATVLLAFGFLGAQYIAWGELINLNEHFTGGYVSHSFIWVLTFMHALHIVSGIIFLLIVWRQAFKYKVHSKNMTLVEMCSVYWHFLGGLWLYLFLFLSLNK